MDNSNILQLLWDEEYKEAALLCGSGSKKWRTELEKFVVDNSWEYLNGDKLFQKGLIFFVPIGFVTIYAGINGTFWGIEKDTIIVSAITFLLFLWSFTYVATICVRLHILGSAWSPVFPLPSKPIRKRHKYTVRFFLIVWLYFHYF